MQTTEDEETEVQITAAVVDLTKDSDIEEVVARDEEDYSSYESDRESGEKYLLFWILSPPLQRES